MSRLRTAFLGRVRFCVWKLLFGEHVEWADKYVEYAVRAETEEV